MTVQEEFWSRMTELCEDDYFIYWLFEGFPDFGEYKSGVPSVNITCLPCLVARDDGKYILTLRKPDGFTAEPVAFADEQRALGRTTGGCKHLLPVLH